MGLSGATITALPVEMDCSIPEISQIIILADTPEEQLEIQELVLEVRKNADELVDFVCFNDAVLCQTYLESMIAVKPELMVAFVCYINRSNVSQALSACYSLYEALDGKPDDQWDLAMEKTLTVAQGTHQIAFPEMAIPPGLFDAMDDGEEEAHMMRDTFGGELAFCMHQPGVDQLEYESYEGGRKTFQHWIEYCLD